MSENIPNKIEGKEIVEDNARKFTLAPLNSEFLAQNNATSFSLIVDWLETGEDNEKKLAYKKFKNGDVAILLISKVNKNGNRTSKKKKITEEEYKALLTSSVLHLGKKRHEFKLNQGATSFSLKYDEFEGAKLCLLEVDADSEEERASFNPNEFPSSLSEVTGDVKYYGYRISSLVQTL